MRPIQDVLRIADLLENRANSSGHRSPTERPARPCTDLGNSERLFALHGDDLRYCHHWKSWLVWDGVRWIRDEGGLAVQRAKDTARAIYHEAAEETDDAIRKETAAWAKRSESKDRISAMLFLAQSDLAITPRDLDVDPWLLNCQNGTLDLRTGELRPHHRDDYLTKLAPVDYAPTAEAPVWSAFLDRIMAGNQQLITFLQRAAGYGCTGSVREECLFFLHGTGKNGKSKFLGGIHDALGDYASTAAPDLLMAKRGDGNHPTELADLFGRRFVSTIESEDGRRFAESLLKMLTGGDQVKARGLYENFWEFNPTHKFYLASNHRPVIKGTDLGIWRRILLIPFEVTIPEAEQDKCLAEKLTGERAGLLAWLVAGCIAWQQDGLQPPEQVRAATESYKQQMDTIGDFLRDRCEEADGLSARSSAIYEAYKQWCQETGEKAESQKALSGRLEERGLKKERDMRGIFWSGIAVAPEEAQS